MTQSCQFNSAPIITSQNLVPAAPQNPSDAYHIDTLPLDAFRIILNGIGVPDIGKVYKCCLVSSDWKQKIEDHTAIFEIACVSLKMLYVSVKKDEAKSSVFDLIKNLKEKAKIGRQEELILFERLPTLRGIDGEYPNDGPMLYHDNKEFEDCILKVVVGLRANLRLLNVGQSTWENVKRYLYTLVSLNQKDFDLPECVCEVFMAAIIEAAKQHLFDDAEELYSDWIESDKNYVYKNLHELLYYFYINDRFFEFWTKHANDFDFETTASVVYKLLCKLLHENNEIDIYKVKLMLDFNYEIDKVTLLAFNNEIDKIKLLACKLLTPLEEKMLAKKLFHNPWEIKDLFNAYILIGEFQKVKTYLSKYPEKAEAILRILAYCNF